MCRVRVVTVPKDTYDNTQRHTVHALLDELLTPPRHHPGDRILGHSITVAAAREVSTALLGWFGLCLPACCCLSEARRSRLRSRLQQDLRTAQG